jgi:hypothetical protein
MSRLNLPVRVDVGPDQRAQAPPVLLGQLGIHNGSLPQRLPEWGRFMLIALLADPGRIIERRFLTA